MVKKELEKLEEKIDELERDLEFEYESNNKLQKALDERDRKIKELTHQDYFGADECKVIYNIDNFVWNLKINGLYNDKMQDFIRDYMLFNNKSKAKIEQELQESLKIYKEFLQIKAEL